MRISLMAILALFTISYGAAAEQTVKHYELNIERQPLDTALKELAAQTGLQVARFSDAVKADTIVGPLSGNYSADEALKFLLAPSGLVYRPLNDRAYIVVTPRELSVTSNARDPLSSAAGALRLAQTEATSGAEPQDARLDEVVITGAKRKFAPTDSSAATKIRMDVIDTPQSMTVLSAELMDIVGVNSLSTAAALAPGVVNQEGEIPVFDYIVARGFEVDAGNGYKINGLSFQSAGGPVDMGIADRFEIVRGPASIIYGQADYGATTNLTLKAPQARRSFAGELGSSIDGAYRAMADVTGALTEDKNLRGRLIVIYDDLKTPQDFAYMNTTTVAPSLSWDVAESTVLDINFFHGERDKRRTNGFKLLQDGETGEISLPDVSQAAFIGAHFNKVVSTMDVGIAKLTHDFGNSWVLSATGTWNNTLNKIHAARIAAPFVPETGIQNLQDLAVIQKTEGVSGDLTLTGDFDALGRSHTLMLNGFYRRHENDYIGKGNEVIGQIDIFDPDPTAFSPAYPRFPTSINIDNPSPDIGFSGHFVSKEAAVSGLLLLRPVDRLSAMLGLRYTDYQTVSTDFFDRSISFQTPDRFTTAATNYRAGLVYEVTDNANVYGSYSTGTIFNVGRTFAGDALPAETGVQWEFGAKAALLDKNLTVAASVFQIDRNNVATGDPDHPDTPFSVVIDGQKHKGFELEAMGEPLPGWNLIASYSYLDVNINMCTRVAGVCTDPFGWNGQQRASAPHDQVKLYTTYQLLGGPLKGFSFGGGMFYVGKREVDNNGTFQLPAYTRFDLRLGYDALEHISFSINAINVTDEKAYIVQQASSGRTLDYQNRRTLMFRMNFKY